MNLIIMFAVISAAALAWGSENNLNNAAIGVFSATLGGLIAVIGQELHRQQEERAHRDNALSALRVEVKFNIGVQKKTENEKHRAYSSSAWEQARPFIMQIKPTAADALRGAYEQVYMHKQALNWELIHSGHGGALTMLSREIHEQFQRALAESEWLK
jgi:hypothetical protein